MGRGNIYLPYMNGTVSVYVYVLLPQINKKWYWFALPNIRIACLCLVHWGCGKWLLRIELKCGTKSLRSFCQSKLYHLEIEAINTSSIDVSREGSIIRSPSFGTLLIDFLKFELYLITSSDNSFVIHKECVWRGPITFRLSLIS